MYFPSRDHLGYPMYWPANGRHTACKCKQIASMWMPSTNSVLGSRTGQACIMNAFKLRLAFSIFSGSIWSLGSFKEPLKVIEFFIGESRVVNRWFIVYSMGQFDLFGLRRETLQQRLNSPGFALARASPKQRGRLFGSALLNQRGIETFLESQPTPCDASRIPGLSRLPSVSVSCLECRLRISGLSKFESTVVCHWICLEFVCAGLLDVAREVSRLDTRSVRDVSKVGTPRVECLAQVDMVWYRSEEHTSELQSPMYLVCRLLLEK